MERYGRHKLVKGVEKSITGDTEPALSSKIAFVIPSHNHYLEVVTHQIEERFPDNLRRFVIIDDASQTTLNFPEGAVVVRHDQNHGLAKSLLRGYQEAIKLPVDFVVRVDADGEYPLYPIGEIVDKLKGSPAIVGAFIELGRSRESNGMVDALFHNTMGIVEGLAILGKPQCASIARGYKFIERKR